MQNCEVKPNVITYSSTISACAKLGQWQQALKLFEEMPAAEILPNAYSFPGLLNKGITNGCMIVRKWPQLDTSRI